jgi:hypothetical protein
VIHVGVGDEHGLDRQQHGARRAIDPAEIDQHGTALPAQRDQQRRITGLPVQQARAQRGLGH